MSDTKLMSHLSEYTHCNKHNYCVHVCVFGVNANMPLSLFLSLSISIPGLLISVGIFRPLLFWQVQLVCWGPRLWNTRHEKDSQTHTHTQTHTLNVLISSPICYYIITANVCAKDSRNKHRIERETGRQTALVMLGRDVLWSGAMMLYCDFWMQ